jgi:hypothetical protein
MKVKLNTIIFEFGGTRDMNEKQKKIVEGVESDINKFQQLKKVINLLREAYLQTVKNMFDNYIKNVYSGINIRDIRNLIKYHLEAQKLRRLQNINATRKRQLRYNNNMENINNIIKKIVNGRDVYNMLITDEKAGVLYSLENFYKSTKHRKGEEYILNTIRQTLLNDINRVVNRQININVIIQELQEISRMILNRDIQGIDDKIKNLFK